MKAPIPIKVPDTAILSNFLFDGLSKPELNHDIVVVTLANGYAIEVDWNPENDPSGAFCVRVLWKFEEKFSRALIDPYEVAKLVEMLAKYFDNDNIPVSNASQTNTATAEV